MKKKLNPVHEAILNREADAFATALLMPAKWVRADVDAILARGGLDEGDIDALAKRYQVSPVRMTMRLVELGYLEVNL